MRDDKPLVLELLNLEQLKRHAVALASRHEIGTKHERDQLLPRLRENEAVLVKADQLLSAAVRNKRGMTPAGEWLLDNFHLIEEQIRTARRHLPKGYCQELPQLLVTGLGPRGVPRVYDIALAVIAHVDGRVDVENVTAFVSAYQEVKPLTLGEFWAIPIMLRLALIENLRRVAARVVIGMSDRDRAIHWTEQVLRTAEHDSKNLIIAVADMARTNPPMSNAFVAELVRNLQGHRPILDIPLTWLEHQISVLGSTTKQMVQMEGQQQAANQVSVSASIGSLRFLGAMDWRNFVESLSFVDQQLRRDPANLYSNMDFTTRDRYRHVIELTAKHSTLTEWEVARKAVELAENHAKANDYQGAATHVGYFLINKGRSKLEKVVLSPTTLPWHFVKFGPRSRKWLFLGSITLVTTALASVPLLHLRNSGLSTATWIPLVIAILLCAGQMALAFVNRLVMALKLPELLPRLDFSKGIPPECITLVAIPSMLVHSKNVEALLEGLEVRFLANREQNLYFALLTDFVDAPTEVMPLDDTLCQMARSGIEALNTRYRGKRGDIFYLLHRPRLWNVHEKVWMGHERKRGKLEALNALLRPTSRRIGRIESDFSVMVGNTAALATVKYVITLDTDTQLPRDAAQKLIGTMAHPLNRPVFGKKSGYPGSSIVTAGYSILQPRVAVSLPGASRSWFSRLSAGDPGVDPYTRAVSDVYQDLFHEGSFIGKGIYDVDAFSQALSNTLPENLILSHDLLEGSYARCGLVSDVLLYEEHPSHFSEDAARRRRWIRGDWQIAYWLLPRVPGADGRWRKNPISWLSKWKIFDNLRRSLVPIATLWLLILGWTSLPNYLFLSHVILGLYLIPAAISSVLEMLNKPAESHFRSHLHLALRGAVKRFVAAALTIVFLPHEAATSLDAIGKSMVRMLISHKHLLAWRSATDPRHSINGQLFQFFRSLAFAPLLALAVLIFLKTLRPEALIAALPYLSLWLFSPVVAYGLSRNIAPKESRLTATQVESLHHLARKTWRFFETFVGPEDHWLPPDNFQEYPTSVVAHRTSPTNIGLSLLSTLSAYDFGYVSLAELLERTKKTFTTLDLLEGYKGHFYNWYDTQTLRPLSPLYISTVDSGNLSGLLLTLRPGLKELPAHKIIPLAIFRGISDTIGVFLSESKHRQVTADKFAPILTALKGPFESFKTVKALLGELSNVITDLETMDPTVSGIETEDGKWWLHALRNQQRTCLDVVLEELAPWALMPAPPDAPWIADLFDLNTIPSLSDVAKLGPRVLPVIDKLLLGEPTGKLWLQQLRILVDSSSRHAATQMLTIAKLAQQCEEFATVDYDFLYDKARHLLAIGYNVGEHRRDEGFYDLLASEARLCSYVAIAQGYLPQEHWFALGRLLTAWKGEPTLLSWSGSMFEYLMPLLIMPTFKNTLLDHTYETSVKRQIEYGRQRGVPWGVSESGYNLTDAQLNYQYRAFGVPGLGFKRGLANDIVIAPYASVMALMVAPTKAFNNLEKMRELGFEGRYGFYEAIDYTPAQLGIGQTHAIVRSFMAHHQGMSFLSLAYQLLDQKMQKRFQSDPSFRATELLLHERVPKAATLYPHASEVSDAALAIGEREETLRVLNTPNTPRPEVHLLSNGRYTVMITNSGGGYSRWKNLAVTRWREDPTRDHWGTFCYIRDVDRGEVWSAAHQPIATAASHYEAIFPQAKAEFRRRDHDLELHTEITVSPEDDIELRRFSITNLSPHLRVIELTSYSEVVLTTQAADEAHPAFSSLFVQTEILADKQAILCSRRPRSNSETTPTMIHLMTVHGPTLGDPSFETDRSHFIGRGRSVSNPLAMEIDSNGTLEQMKSRLCGHDGSVLDPIVAIRCRIEIEPEQTVRVHVVTGIGETRGAALELIETYRDRYISDRVFDLARTHQQVALRQSNMSEADAQLFGRLASSVLFANPLRRANASILAKNRRGQAGLWGHGISGDLPIILLRIGDLNAGEIVRQLVQVHSYWRKMGLHVELIIWNEDDSGYRQNLNDRIMLLIAAGDAIHQVDRPGGIFVRRGDQLSEEDRILLQTVARVIVTDTGGTLAEQVDRRGRVQTPVPALIPLLPEATAEEMEAAPAPVTETLGFPNAFGGFSPDGREYRITTGADTTTPAPWVNVIANPHFGTVISESGSAYTWCENAHEYRLTPWSNDALSDTSGEAFYLRDEDTGHFWSPTPLPARSQTSYETSHGFGYSKFRHSTAGMSSDLTIFVAIDAPIKISILKLHNTSNRPRRISATGYCEWVMGELRPNSLMHITTEIDPTNAAIFARNPYHSEFGGRVAFFDLSEKVRSVTGDRSEFLGRNGHHGAPAAMLRTHLSGRVGAALDPCAAMQTILDFAPNQEREVVFVLGVGRDDDDARTLIRRFGSLSAAHLAKNGVAEYWEHTLSVVQIKTPDPSIDVLTNGWLMYQVLACRMWARSGFYQSGGAFGFRDQLQDAMALLHAKPRLLRDQILLCASRQFREGDVQHWWHPPSGRGVRTHFSDDYLWLPLATSRYVLSIGDLGVLDVPIEFIEGRQLKPGEEAYSDLPKRSDESATLYEHCVRAINRGLRFGIHGLPLIGGGDWNDGMNLVGENGKGESVWLAFFLFDVLTQFSKVAERVGDQPFAKNCLSHAAQLQASIEKNGWDGEWYRRAYFDDGRPLGSNENAECQIDSLPQSWAVLSGAGDSMRSRKAMAAVERRLVDREHSIIKLFDPPFDTSDVNPGYIKGYVPGVRENGGQYTHAAIWAAMAFASLGEKQRAWELLAMINPLTHTSTTDGMDIYKVEPYVIAADVYAVEPHAGRGGWTWYTGSAGWMYRLIFESLLGIRLEVDTLYFSPCVPDHWREFQVNYRFRNTNYAITLKPADPSQQRGGVIVDGEVQAGQGLRLIDDQENHSVEVRY